MQKIGRSGVELHEIRKHVTLDDETALPTRPVSNYTPRKGGKSRNHPLGLFPGIGDFVPMAKRKVPKLPTEKLATLLAVYRKKSLSRDNAVCKALNKMELIFWSSTCWITTWKGDEVAKKYDKK